ncbi:MAG TPA: alpha/beta fold hydrolase, partial [Acidimicrobiales bacterium]
MNRSPVRAVGVIALGAALLASACSVSGKGDQTSAGTGSRRGSSATTQTEGPSSGGGRRTLSWSSCDHGFQCASMKVPLDYTKPDGRKLTLAMARRPASDPSERIGSLFINPGGPGASAIETIENIVLPDTLTDHFDIVGFDPRGVGQSSPIDCHSHLQEMYDTDPVLDTPAEKAAYLKVSQEFVDECARKYKAVLPFLGTQNVARDMDEVRKAVGDAKLTYLGYSYGTSIGQQYAQLFPTHIRAMVLDGVVDEDETGLQAAGEQAGGFEVALKAFLADCKASSSCPIGPNPQNVLDDVLAQSAKKPIPAPRADRPAGRGVMELGVGQAL